MTRILIYSLFFMTYVLFSPLYAQKPSPINFIHIGLNEGLSQSTVFDINQDKQGNMWFATHNGLNKYDGYSFTVYRHNDPDLHSIASDIIRTCTIDKQDRLWVGTNDGLSLYDAKMDHFENFAYLKNGKKLPVNGIVTANDKLLLLYSRKEQLLFFDTETMQFTDNPLTTALSTIIPTALYRQGDHIYIGSHQGLHVYSIRKNTLEDIVPEQLKGKEIYTILQQSPIHLWVGTEGNGLFCINPQTNKVSNYTHHPNEKNSISSNYIRSLSLNSQNKLWIGTLNSLNIYNAENDNFNVYNSDPLESGSLSQTSVRNIFMDSQGGMWLGTYFGGLNYYHPFKDRFYNLQSTAKENSLNCNIIGCIREDTDNNIWIGTNSGGVNCYNPLTRTFKHYTQKDGLGSNDVKTIYIDEANDLVYIGTHTGGLSILNRRSGHIETCTYGANNIYTLEPSENGEFWISGMSSLMRFNPRNKSFTAITTQADGKPFLHYYITAIMRDSKRRLWLISEKGLDVYTEKDGLLLHCPILPPQSPVTSKMINCVHEAKQEGVFWVGTRSGIYRFDENTKETKQYTTEQGLPNNVVHAIMEDSYGYLWISTDKGLSRFRPQTGKFRNYADTDGIQSNQFTNNAHCHTANGLMYFGGINGITTFQPEQMPDNPYIPPVVIKHLSLFNKIVLPDDETGILTKNISETNSITLAAEQSMFSLEFVVSNYISGNHNTFAYILEGHDKEWYYTTNLRTVSYSNLPQGTYRFLVKAANNDGKWNELPTELGIVVLPMWYNTWWAILLFITLFIAATVFIFYYFWMRKSMKAQMQMELADKERQKQMNEMKLQFFINISHELRTPLTMILAPLQEVLDETSDRRIHKQLGYVQKNTKRLLHLVNQLMDYRRAELGVFHLKVRRNATHQVVKKIFLLYERAAQRKQITYNFYSEIEGQEVLCDPGYLELIMSNLISNALKYTNEGQSIAVNLKIENGKLMLQVKDTGSGIPLNKQSKLFERFYQIDNEHIGTGIGLSLVHRLVDLHHGEIKLVSSEGEGSTFTIYLPIEEEAYSAEKKLIDANVEEEERVHSTNSIDMHLTDTNIGEETTEETTTAADTKEGKRETILIVEDNVDIRQYLSEKLGRTYQIMTAENGEEALDLLKEQDVDLILTDVMMPVMDGLKLCKHIKQNLYTCHIPVIMLSAKTDLKEQLEGLQVGADDYIPKPFSMTLVTTKIKNLFRTRYRAIEHYSNSLEIEPEKVALNQLDESFLKRAVETVEKHIDNVEFSTDEFAREMYMSRSNLHLKMKALTGESTNEFIRKIRFNKACKLLKEGRYNVAEISTMVGFNTPSYFTTSFKKYVGCLPSEYTKTGLK